MLTRWRGHSLIPPSPRLVTGVHLGSSQDGGLLRTFLGWNVAPAFCRQALDDVFPLDALLLLMALWVLCCIATVGFIAVSPLQRGFGH